jgi:hypothetical protein
MHACGMVNPFVEPRDRPERGVGAFIHAHVPVHSDSVIYVAHGCENKSLQETCVETTKKTSVEPPSQRKRHATA